jgi:phosphonate degradation associated HDIG domain protein
MTVSAYEERIMPSIDDCVRLLRERGDSEYGGESVTQIEHALQCAMLAEQDDASAELISAALLHDVGHLLHSLADDAPDRGIDDAHEDLGQRYLQRIFGDSVAVPVRLHVPAKRYMCATLNGYQERLSEPSIVSLRLQGGPMSAPETKLFEQNSFAKDAVRLRHWDDAAKIPGLRTPPLEHYIQYLRMSVR